jgi:hypothetical protein
LGFARNEIFFAQALDTKLEMPPVGQIKRLVGHGANRIERIGCLIFAGEARHRILSLVHCHRNSQKNGNQERSFKEDEETG